MMAPRHHGAMRHVAGPRVELGTRTIFNLLGPLANPAGVKRQLMGVFAAEWVEPVAEVLGRLGSRFAWVVHGSDGLDELTTTGPTLVAEWDGSRVRRFEVTPEEAGLPRSRPRTSRAAIRHTTPRRSGPCSPASGVPLRDAVVLGAAAALLVAGRAQGLREGAGLAAASIAAGPPGGPGRLVQITNRPAVRMSDVLQRICAVKRERIARRRTELPLARLRRSCPENRPAASPGRWSRLTRPAVTR